MMQDTVVLCIKQMSLSKYVELYAGKEEISAYLSEKNGRFLDKTRELPFGDLVNQLVTFLET